MYNNWISTSQNLIFWNYQYIWKKKSYKSYKTLPEDTKRGYAYKTIAWG